MPRQSGRRAGNQSGDVAGDQSLPASRLSDDLRRAARWWTRRGYRITYADDGLVQLSRTALVYRESIVPFAAAAMLGGLAIALVVRGMRRRAWHVVSITLTPDHRIITHRLWTRRPVRS